MINIGWLYFWEKENKKLEGKTYKEKYFDCKEKLQKKSESHKAAHNARVKYESRVKAALKVISQLPKESVKIKRSDIDTIKRRLEGLK